MRDGFTLIELMIAVALIAVLAAIAIPNMLGAKKSANEATSIESLRVINSAQTLYSQRDPDDNGTDDFAPTLALLNSYDLIDGVLASGTKSGYYYTLFPTGNATRVKYSYGCFAQPGQFQISGDRSFLMRNDGVMWVTLEDTSALLDPETEASWTVLD